MWKGKLSRQDAYKIIDLHRSIWYSTMSIFSSVLTSLSKLLQNTADKRQKSNKKQSSTNMYKGVIYPFNAFLFLPYHILHINSKWQTPCPLLWLFLLYVSTLAADPKIFLHYAPLSLYVIEQRSNRWFMLKIRRTNAVIC